MASASEAQSWDLGKGEGEGETEGKGDTDWWGRKATGRNGSLESGVLRS